MADYIKSPAKCYQKNDPKEGNNSVKTYNYGNAVPPKPSGGPSIQSPARKK